jgi:ArsR family transcriptional regulator
VPGTLDPATALKALKAAADPTRLRILALLARGELNVKDLTRVLGQSQPRISRHLKLLADAALIERAREGSWVYFHLAEARDTGLLPRILDDMLDAADPLLLRDRERAEAIKRERATAAQAYFAAHAAEWDRIRGLHVAEVEVEAAMSRALGPGPFDLLADLGTGTGRILELFGPRARRAIGIDLNHAMLAYARSRLEREGLRHCQVRHGDIYDVPLADAAADAVVMHQVLHFLLDPPRAIAEASRIVRPGGRLLIVDFAPHELEFVRKDYAHERLGFADAQIAAWLEQAGLEASGASQLAPPAREGEAKLTVSLWLARRPAEARQPRPQRTWSAWHEG